ncbi:FAD-binding oxidoreductase [soil metagenome]
MVKCALKSEAFFEGQTTVNSTADIVIIGAGIMGCAIAYALAEKGAKNIVVLERDQIGRGATADAAGGIRQQFSTETNVKLARHSVRVWEEFGEQFGQDISLRQQGYLFLLSDPADRQIFEQNLAMQQRLGVPVRWLSTDEIHDVNPYIELQDVYGGTYCPEDGWVDTYAATIGYATAARRLGVVFEEGSEAVEILRNEDAIFGVRTNLSLMSSPLVIISAGPFTRQVGRLAGVDIPVDPYRRMSFVTEPFDAMPPTLPMTIEFSSGLYFHPESGGFLFGMGNRDEPSSLNKTVDEEWMATTVEALVNRAPAFDAASILNGWAGFYEVTPDDNPVIGFVPGVEGLAVAAGFSGHGFMQGPAIGICMAELLLVGAATTVDIHEFRPSRFAEGTLAQEHNVI